MDATRLVDGVTNCAPVDFPKTSVSETSCIPTLGMAALAKLRRDSLVLCSACRLLLAGLGGMIDEEEDELLGCEISPDVNTDEDDADEDEDGDAEEEEDAESGLLAIFIMSRTDG